MNDYDDDDINQDVLELAGQGYSCAQIIVIMCLRIMGKENPDLIRALSTLAMGASFGSLCGALTGGLCLLGLHTGKGALDEQPVFGGRLISTSLIKWFIAEELHGKTPPMCASIFEAGGRKFTVETASPIAACANLVTHTFNKSISLLRELEIDPSLGRD
jgi:hypothetical protein